MHGDEGLDGFLQRMPVGDHGMVVLGAVALGEALAAGARGARGAAEQLVVGGVLPPGLPEGARAFPEAPLQDLVPTLAGLAREARAGGLTGALVLMNVEALLRDLGPGMVALAEEGVGRAAPEGVRLVCLYTRVADQSLPPGDFRRLGQAHARLLLGDGPGKPHEVGPSV